MASNKPLTLEDINRIDEVDESNLRDFYNPEAVRNSIFQRTLGAFEQKFPLENEFVKIEASNWRYDPAKMNYGISKSKDALMKGSRLATPLYADVKLIDQKTGKVIDQKKNHLMANVPYLTDRGTFVMGGTEYVTVNQTRLRPGIYTRLRENGETEAHINVRAGTGTGMRMFMEPETGIFRVKIGESRIKLYPILNKLGVSDDEMVSAWGQKVFDLNQKATDTQAFTKFYDRLVGDRGSRLLTKMREESIKTPRRKKASKEELTEDKIAFYDAVTNALANGGDFGTKEFVEAMAAQGFSHTPETDSYEKVKQALASFVLIEKSAGVVVSGRPNDFDVHVHTLREARERINKNPSEAQTRAGNYSKGHVRIQGIDISIENPKGGVRRGTNRNGKSWEVKLTCDYGYIKGTKGSDGDPVDVFLGDHLDSEVVFVIDQRVDGKFDEHKVMIGFKTSLDAKKAYFSNFTKGWNGMMAITDLTMTQFKWWLRNGNKKAPISVEHTPKFAEDFQQWIGVDLDGTLAMASEGFDPNHIGEPIKQVYDLVHGLVSNGDKVKIFTARAANPENIPVIQEWLNKHGLGDCEITNEKDPGMQFLIDDRAISAVKNKGVDMEEVNSMLKKRAAFKNGSKSLEIQNASFDINGLTEAVIEDVSKRKVAADLLSIPNPLPEIKRDEEDLSKWNIGDLVKKVANDIAAEEIAIETPKLTDDDKIELVKYQLKRMEFDPEINYRNLGILDGTMGATPLLATSKKLLAINRGMATPDDRDSKANQTFHSVDDFMEERILKDAGGIGRALLFKSRYNGSLKSLSPGMFTKQLEGLILSNSLSQAVPGINPVELMDVQEKVVQTGEGGIGNTESIPLESRNVHISQVGVIDPIRTPESGSVGVDQRFSAYARKGPGNQVYMPLINKRTGKKVWRTPSQVYGKTIMFPRQIERSK